MTCPTAALLRDGVAAVRALGRDARPCPTGCCELAGIETCNFLDDDCDGETDEEGRSGALVLP